MSTPIEISGAEDDQATLTKGPTSFALSGIRSVHGEASKRHEAYVTALQANKPAKPRKATAAKKDEPRSVRHQASQIIGSITPPARADSFLRAATQTTEGKRHTDLTSTIRKIKALLSKTYTAEELAGGATPPSAEQRVQGLAQIARCQQIIKDEDLAAHVVRIADNTAPAVAIFIDWMAINLVDIAASNTHANGRKMTEAKFTLDAASQPTEKQGGLSFANSNVACFLAELPTIKHYNQEEEDELKRVETERKKGEREGKKDQATKRAQNVAQGAEAFTKQMNATITELRRGVEQGQNLTAADGSIVTPEMAQQQIVFIEKQIEQGDPHKFAEAQYKAQEEAKPSARKAPSERNFLTYVEQLCRAAQNLHPAYQQMRVANRFKHQIGQLIEEFIERFGAMVRSSITSNTLNGANVMRMLEARQRFAGRPEAEILNLRNIISSAIDNWELHNQSEKVRKEAAHQEKLAAMSPEERYLIEQKRLSDERQRLESSLAAQRARAEKAQREASEKEAKLQALTAAPPAAYQQAAAYQQPPVTAGFQMPGMPQ
jgi:hypothetical protein